MTQAQKLEALVQKAIDGGWDYGSCPTCRWGATKDDAAHSIVTTKEEFYGTLDNLYGLESLIFSHDFAKSLFGNLMGYEPVNSHLRLLNWQYHLQQAVISDNPIDYLYKEVFGDE